MKRLVAIFLLSFYVLSLTEVTQLLKVPSLMEHYVEHKQKDSKLTLFGFLSMHYAQENDHDGDSEEDQKLPFKSHHGCINISVFAFVPTAFFSISTNLAPTEVKSYSVRQENFLSAAYLSSIWQPPKIS